MPRPYLETYFDRFPTGILSPVEWSEYYRDISGPLSADADARRDDPEFNIWEAMALRRGEVLHCRFLAWLLEPTASHGQGARFLTLMDRVCRDRGIAGLLPVSAAGQRCSVRTEHGARDGDRIDITVTGPSFIVVIEAKIDAGEQDRQLERYGDWARTLARQRGVPTEHVRIFFLTPDARRSSSGEAIPLGWRDVAEACARLASETKDTPGGAKLALLLRGFSDHLVANVIQEHS